MQENHKYVYDGPVMMFGRWIGNFKGETTAESEEKARCNLAYQFKKKNNRIAGTKIDLPGKITMVS